MITFSPTKIAGAYVGQLDLHRDTRGYFTEGFRYDMVNEFLSSQGQEPFQVLQNNISRSWQGVVRGVHYAQHYPSQAKYISVLEGEIIDFFVDLRVGSPTYGALDAVDMTPDKGYTVYLPKGVGHGFLTLSSEAVVSYLVDSTYSPDNEKGISIFSSELAELRKHLNIFFPEEGWQLSDKDLNAPTFLAAELAGTLPTYDPRTLSVL